VEAVHSGESPTLQETLKTEIDLLLAGKNRNDFPGAGKAAEAAKAPTAPLTVPEGGKIPLHAPATAGTAGQAPTATGANPPAGEKKDGGQ
jgi:hypothetical protein